MVIKQSDQTEQYMKKAVELNGIHLNHQDNTYILRIDYVDDRKSVNDYDRSVFVGNLSFAINENEVYKFFENCGEIENVRIVRDPTNNIGKGIAFVTFKSKDSIKNALTFHNTKFGDRLLRVMKAVQNKKIQLLFKLNKKNIYYYHIYNAITKCIYFLFSTSCIVFV